MKRPLKFDEEERSQRSTSEFAIPSNWRRLTEGVIQTDAYSAILEGTIQTVSVGLASIGKKGKLKKKKNIVILLCTDLGAHR